MVIIVLWVICGIVSAVIANAKGRSVVGWFFLGLIFGVLAVIIIACLRSNQASMTDVLAAQKLIEMSNDRPGTMDSAVLAQAHKTISSAR
jgi:hypothetical protein